MCTVFRFLSLRALKCKGVVVQRLLTALEAASRSWRAALASASSLLAAIAASALLAAAAAAAATAFSTLWKAEAKGKTP